MDMPWDSGRDPYTDSVAEMWELAQEGSGLRPSESIESLISNVQSLLGRAAANVDPDLARLRSAVYVDTADQDGAAPALSSSASRRRLGWFWAAVTRATASGVTTAASRFRSQVHRCWTALRAPAEQVHESIASQKRSMTTTLKEAGYVESSKAV